MKNNIIKIACINKACPDYGKIDNGNVKIRREVGRDKIKMCICSTCKTEFSERNGTPLFNMKLPVEKIEQVVKHLSEGCGIRATSRMTGIDKDTVSRISNNVGLHSKNIHDKLVRNIQVDELQMDEKWSFVGKKDKMNTEQEEKKRFAMGSCSIRFT
jgi:transposase-like protein